MDARVVLSVFVGGVLVLVALAVSYVVTEALDWGVWGYVVILLALAGLAVLATRSRRPAQS